MDGKIILITVLLLASAYAAPAPQADDLLCELCHIMVRDLKLMLGENATEAEVEGAIDSICNRLASGQDTCTSMVHQYLPPLFDKISGNLEPESACQTLEVCPAQSRIEPSSHNAIGSVLKDVEKKIETKDVEASNNTCNLCMFVIQYLDAELTVNSTEAEINSTLLKVCSQFDSLSGIIGDLCRQVEPRIMLLVKNGLIDPQKACVLVKLCDQKINVWESDTSNLPQPNQTPVEPLVGLISVETSDVIQHIAEKNKKGKPVVWKHKVDASNITCELCEFLMQILDTVVAANRSEAAINNTLWKACDALNGFIPAVGSMCYEEEPKLLKAVEAGVDPEKACVAVRMCTTASRVVRIQDLSCDVCKSLVTEVVGKAGEEVCERMQGVCVQAGKKVPKSVVNDVDSYVDSVLKSEPLEEEENNSVEPEQDQIEEEEEEDEPEANPIECAVCKFLVDELEKKYLKNKTAAEINATILALCNDLPESIQPFCTKLAPTIVTYVINDIADPSKLCADLKLCDATAENENLLEEMKESFEEESKVEANPLECSICKALVDELEERLANNKSESAINATVFKLCSELPGSVQPFCTTNAPRIVAFLVKEINADPTVVCTALKLCDANETETSFQQEEEVLPEEMVMAPQANPLECSICKALVDELEERLANNKSESAINATVFKLCSELPGSVQPFCTTNAPRIVAFLVKEINTDPTVVCTTLKLCDANETETSFQQEEEVLPEEMVMAPQDEECDACKFIVNLIDQVVLANKSAATINTTITNFCNSLPTEFKLLCHTVAPELIKTLEHGFNATSACITVKFCNANGTYNSLSSQNLQSSILQTIKENEGGVLECEICDLIITVVDELIHTNNSKEYINTTLFEVCEILPSEVKQFCYELSPKLINEIEKGWNITYLCQKLSACVNEKEVVEPEVEEPEIEEPELEEPETEVENVEDDPKCQICKLFVQLLNAYIDRNTSAATINSTVYKLCDSLPSDLKGTCHLFAPEIEKAVLKGLSPEKACADVKLCANETVSVIEEPVEKIKEEVGDTYCEVCKLVVRNIDAYIGKNKSQAAINSSLENVCNKIPSDLKYFCELLKPTIIKDIENGLDPQKTCTEVKLCTNGSMKAIEKEEIPPPELEVTVGVDARCELCKFFLQLIDNELKKGTTVQALNETLLTVCSLLPVPLNSTCMAVVPKLLNTIATGIVPQQACIAATFCVNNTSPKTHFLTCETCHGIVEFINPRDYDPEDADTICNMACPRRYRRSAPKSNLMRQIIMNKKGHLKVGQTWDCSVCEFLSQTANVLLTDNHTEDSVEKTLKNICKYLPSPYDSACTSSAVEVIHEIEHGFDSREVCSKVTGDSCDNSSAMVRKFLEEFGKPEHWECNFCVKALGFVNDALDKDTNQVHTYIETVCERLPTANSEACKKFIETQSNEVVNRIINQLLNPTKVCQMVKFCPASHPNNSFL